MIGIFCISGWLAVPINPDKWSSTVFAGQFLLHSQTTVSVMTLSNTNLACQTVSVVTLLLNDKIQFINSVKGNNFSFWGGGGHTSVNTMCR